MSRFKKEVNKQFDHWKFTDDGKFSKCKGRKNKKMRRRHQRALEKEDLNKIIKRECM